MSAWHGDGECYPLMVRRVLSVDGRRLSEARLVPLAFVDGRRSSEERLVPLACEEKVTRLLFYGVVK